MDDPGEDFIRDIDDGTLEALIETMYLAAYADGVFSEPERSHFATSVDRLTDSRLAGPELETVLARVVKQHKSAGREARIDAIKAQLGTTELRRIALVLATDMVAADGVLHEAERELIGTLAASFGFAEDEAEELLEGSLDR